MITTDDTQGMDLDIDGEGNAAAVIKAISERSGARLEKLEGGIQVAIRPDGQIVSVKRLIDEYRVHPERSNGTTALNSEASFVSHVNAFKADRSVIYVTENGACCAIYNHQSKNEPDNNDHRAAFTPGLHPEFLRWSGHSEKWLSQEAFADLIQSGFDSIREPVPTTLIDRPGGSATMRLLADGLEITIGRKVANRVRLQSGETRITFEEEHKDSEGKPLAIPDGFLLGLPVFNSQTNVFPVWARLRYRVKDKEISWQVKLIDLDKVRDVAIIEHCNRIATQTGLPVYRGVFG